MTRRTLLLDASALLAVLFGEPGSDVVERIIDDCTIHAVSPAETLRKMLKTGVPPRKAESILDSLDLEVNTILTQAEALAAGQLAFEARGSGLSIGGCVCLSVSAQTGRRSSRRTGDGQLSQRRHSGSANQKFSRYVRNHQSALPPALPD